jgi:tRNA-binding EMAP/Myf-like protein
MKPSKFKGVLSTAMVLAANSDDHSQVVLVTPPADAPVGERLAVEGYNKTTDPHPLQLNPKKNEWETVKPVSPFPS